MAACYSSIKHHKLKSATEGEEEIGFSQEPLRIILQIHQLCVSYGLKKRMYNFISITMFMETSYIILSIIVKSSTLTIFY